MPSLSAILIAKNEELDLPGCLESVRGLATEIVVVVTDDTSDRTESTARAFSAKVVRRPFDDYARMRQASLELATSEWCLWIDPDERLTPELAAEIRRTLDAGTHSVAFSIPFSVTFMGRVMKWGGLGHERHIRLFRRSRARFTGGVLHESLLIEGKVAELNGRMIHTPYRDLSDYLVKLDRYTSLAAKKRFDAGKSASLYRHLILPWEFFSRAVLKLGILDGRQGLVWAGLSAFHSWLKYVKLAQMCEEERK